MKVAVLASNFHGISDTKKKRSNSVTCPASYFINLLAFSIVFLLEFSVWPFSTFKESCYQVRGKQKIDAAAMGSSKPCKFISTTPIVAL